MVGKRFTAFSFAGYFAGYNECCRCHANHTDSGRLCLGIKNVEGGSWLPEPPKRQPKLRELQAVHNAVFLQAR
jgi:hypothetical protein